MLNGAQWWAYSIGMLCRPSGVVRPSTIFKDLLQNCWAYQSQNSCRASIVKFYSEHLGHMTKMAATPIFGGNPSKILFSGTKGPMTLGLGM